MNFDHILLLGYGAPERAEEVMPYLRSMSEGRGVPEERLKSIARHYELIGGASPYNFQVSEFSVRLEREFGSEGIGLPIFTGMKNWHPFLGDTLRGIYQKGLRRGMAIPLTPYRAASAGAGYKESLESIRAALGMNDLCYHFSEGWSDQPLFIEAEEAEVSCALQTVAPAERAEIPILFSFHALPVHHDPAHPVSRYAEEARAASALVAERMGHKKWTVVYQSRPGFQRSRHARVALTASLRSPVSVPETWLSPEIGEAIKSLAAKGEKRVLVVPLGFICDHAEILYDLDHAVREAVEKSGMKYLRAKTVLHHPKIAALFRALIEKSSP